MLFMVNTTWQALAASGLFVVASLVAFAIGEREAGLILVGFAGGTGIVGRREAS